MKTIQIYLDKLEPMKYEYNRTIIFPWIEKFPNLKNEDPTHLAASGNAVLKSVLNGTRAI